MVILSMIKHSPDVARVSATIGRTVLVYATVADLEQQCAESIAGVSELSSFTTLQDQPIY